MAQKTKCDLCDRTFKDHDGLEQHRKTKHLEMVKEDNKKESKSGIKYIVYGIVTIMLIYGAYALLSGEEELSNYDIFAKCLSDSGAKFYGAFWCPHCLDQKEKFGSPIKYVNYIECSTPDRKAQLAVCNNAGINSYPTWIFNDGTRQGGILTFSELSSKTGCALP